jgi:paraquat-inducible protein B
MSKKSSPAAIGGFVLGAIVLLVVGIVAFSSGKLFREKALYVSYFPGTVAGLSVGAPVQFQGVQVGQVVDIKLDYYRDEGRFSIPVTYELWADRLRTRDADGRIVETVIGASQESLKILVEQRGLRAQLTSLSLVTGQYVVSLEMLPGTDFVYVGADAGLLEVPTVEGARDKLRDAFQNLDLQGLVSKASRALEAVTAFVESEDFRNLPSNVEGLIGDARDTIKDLDAKVEAIGDKVDVTLTDYQTLARTATARVDTLADAVEETAGALGTLSTNVNQKVEPLARSVDATLKSAKQTFETYDDLAAPESATRTNLDVLLEEAAGAARSLRILADYLEQNPDALIKGKY